MGRALFRARIYPYLPSFLPSSCIDLPIITGQTHTGVISKGLLFKSLQFFEFPDKKLNTMLLSNLYSTKTKKSTKYGAQATHPDPPDPGGSYPRYRDEYTSSPSHHWLKKRERKARSSPSRQKSTTRHHTVTKSSQPPLATTTMTRSRERGSSHSTHSLRATRPSHLATQPLLQEECPSERRHETTHSHTTTNHNGSSFWTIQLSTDPIHVRKRERVGESVRVHAGEVKCDLRSSRDLGLRHPGEPTTPGGERVRKRVRFVVDEGEGREDDNIQGMYVNSTYSKPQQA